MSEIPEKDELLQVMKDHFENGRFKEAWALREHWTMAYKELAGKRPRTLSKRREHSVELGALAKIKDLLQWEYDRLSDEYDIERHRFNESFTHSNPHLFLEFVEEKLKYWGGLLEGAKTEPPRKHTLSEKELYQGVMNSLVVDMFRYFNIDHVSQLDHIEDANIRNKVIELVELCNELQGVDIQAAQKVEESSLVDLL